jgi:hypothetical protein
MCRGGRGREKDTNVQGGGEKNIFCNSSVGQKMTARLKIVCPYAYALTIYRNSKVEFFFNCKIIWGSVFPVMTILLLFLNAPCTRPIKYSVFVKNILNANMPCTLSLKRDCYLLLPLIFSKLHYANIYCI